MQHTKKILGNFRLILRYKVREIYCTIVFKWILHKSQLKKINSKPAIVFAPHQDDETLGCGGLIALKCAQKIPVKVVFMTDGRYGSLNPVPVEEITEVRKKEALSALEKLGLPPSEIYFLEQIDGNLKYLSEEDHQQVITKLTDLLKSFRPEEIYVPHRQDIHADHEATYNLVQEAVTLSGIQVEILQYPIWILWQHPLYSELKLDEISNSYRISISEVQDKKNQAISSYPSQLTTLPAGFLNRFYSSYEIFFKTHNYIRNK